MLIYKHTFYCENCARTFEANFPEGEPTLCPVNLSHTIRSGSDSIIETIESTEASTPVTIMGTDFKGRIRTVDTSRSDPYTWSYFTSAGDNGPSGIGEGNDFSASVLNQLSELKTIDFMEDVEMHYGTATFQNMILADRTSVWAHAPATPTKVYEAGIRLVKAEIIQGSGLHILVPNANGGYQFDETDGKHPIPVESYDDNWNPTGYWDRVLNPTGYNYSSSAYTFNEAGTGQFNFYDFAIDLGWFVNNCRMLSKNNNTIVFANEDAFRCYKGWQLKLLLENGDVNRTEPAQIAVILKLNRKTIR